MSNDLIATISCLATLAKNAQMRHAALRVDVLDLQPTKLLALGVQRTSKVVRDVLAVRVPGHDGQRFRSDGGQHSGGMTDTVSSSWRTICASERNPVRHRGEVSGMIPERTIESAVDST